MPRFQPIPDFIFPLQSKAFVQIYIKRNLILRTSSCFLWLLRLAQLGSWTLATGKGKIKLVVKDQEINQEYIR